MPLPFILIGGAIAATALGAKKAHDGYKDVELANDIIKGAKLTHDIAKTSFDHYNDKAGEILEKLGTFELQIGEDFEKFRNVVDDIIKKNNFNNFGSIEIEIPKHQLNQIEEVAISATTYLSTVVAGGASSAATGFAVYGGVMALGAASTGTPIAALSGVAAYNATMAAIGGGSLAAGGLGMAGGTMILGGAVLAPILAVAGLAYAIHGANAYNKACDIRAEVEAAVSKMAIAKDQLVKIRNYAQRIYTALSEVYEVFNGYFEILKQIHEFFEKNDEQELINRYGQIELPIQSGMALAAKMAKLISTPLFKVKRDEQGKIMMQDGIPQIELDQDGMQVLDTVGLEEALKEIKH